MLTAAHIASAHRAQWAKARRSKAAHVQAATVHSAPPPNGPPESTTSSRVVLQRDFVDQVTASGSGDLATEVVIGATNNQIRITIPTPIGSSTAPVVTTDYVRGIELNASQAAQDATFLLYIGSTCVLINTPASQLTQNTARLLGRWSAGVGAVQEVQIGSGLSLSVGGVLSATGGGGGGGATTYAEALACNDGNTHWRFVVTQPAVFSTDQIALLGIRRDAADEYADTYFYLAHVVSVSDETFTVEVAAVDEDGQDVSDVPPNETVTLLYQIVTP